MRSLWLVRHARPLVAAGLCYGRLDVPADPAETVAAAEALALTLPPDCRVVTSPLQRCTRLTEALQRLRPALPVTQDPRIAEMDFGAWEGRIWSDLGEAALGPWTADFANFAPGGGETVTTFMARVGAALDAIGHDDTVWVTHAGVIRAATLLAKGLPPPRSSEDWPSGDIVFGSCTRLRLPVRSAPEAHQD